MLAARSLLFLTFITLFAFWKRVKSENPGHDLVLVLAFLTIVLIPALLAMLTELSDPEEMG